MTHSVSRIPALSLGVLSILSGLTSLPAAEAKLGKPTRLTADGELLDIRPDMSYAGPLVVDVDDDGRDDLIVTSIRGQFRYFQNVAEGENAEPVYKNRGHLEAEGKALKLHNW